jgi:tellurite resistance-related uncharacterized protein
MPHQLPQGAYLQDISAHYNQLTIPRTLLRSAPLASGFWGRLVVEQGKLRLFLDGAAEPRIVTPQDAPVIPAGVAFKVEEAGEAVRFYLEYYHVPRLDDGAELAGLLAGNTSRRSGSRR